MLIDDLRSVEGPSSRATHGSGLDTSLGRIDQRPVELRVRSDENFGHGNGDERLTMGTPRPQATKRRADYDVPRAWVNGADARLDG
jgi:hypothetical protein